MRLTAFAISALALFALASITALPASDSAAAHLKKSRVGGLCGGLVGFQCRRDLFCDFAPSAQCGAADQTGTCARRPQICPMIYAPVCGCDGKTYGNDCQRQGAGTGKLHDGACQGT